MFKCRYINTASLLNKRGIRIAYFLKQKNRAKPGLKVINVNFSIQQ